MPFIALLNNLGLRNMIKYKGHWSPEVIRAFYSSLEYMIREIVLLADVIGKNIIINEAKLSNILGYPCSWVSILLLY